MTLTLDEVWGKSLLQIEKRVGNNVLDLWFKPVKLSQVKDQQIILEIPNRFFKDWIEEMPQGFKIWHGAYNNETGISINSSEETNFIL